MEGDQPRLPRSLTLEEFLEEDHGSPGSPPGSRVDQDRWKLFTEAFGDSSKQSKTGLTRFIKAMHAAIETGEALPITVWKHKKERGLKALTEPLALKLRSVRNGEVQTQKLQVAAEPLLQLADLTRFLTKVTPCVDEAYLHFCHRIIGHRIRDFRSEKEYEVKSFEIYTLGLPIPIHTVMATDGEATESWVLANRTYHILGDLAATNVAQLELKVAFNIIQALSGDYMASLEQLQERLDGAEAAKISEATLAAALASALQMAEANRQEVLDFLAAEKARCASLGNLQLTIASQSQRRGASVAPLAKLMGTVPDSLVEELLQRRASWSTLSTAEMTVGEVNIKRPDLNRCIALGQRPHTSHIRLFFEERTEKEAGEELTKSGTLFSGSLVQLSACVDVPVLMTLQVFLVKLGKAFAPAIPTLTPPPPPGEEPDPVAVVKAMAPVSFQMRLEGLEVEVPLPGMPLSGHGLRISIGQMQFSSLEALQSFAASISRQASSLSSP